MATDRTFEDALHPSLPGSDGSAPDLDRTGGRPSTWEDKINGMAAQHAQNAATLAKCFQSRKLRPNAFPDSGRHYD